MQTKTILDVMGAIVVVALVTTVVTSANSAAVIQAFGDAFSGSIKSAMGN